MAIRKKFVDIEIPLIDETVSVLGTPESLKGKTIKLDMTRKMRGKSLEIVFKVFNIDEKLFGLPKKMTLMKFYIRRMMRKRSNYVEDSFTTGSKDIKVILKPLLITRKKVSRAVRNNLRKTAREFLVDYVKSRTYLELCEDIYHGELQKSMIPKLKKVYPLSFSDIRVFETKDIDKAEQPKAKHIEKKEQIEEKPVEPKEPKKTLKEKKPKLEDKEAKPKEKAKKTTKKTLKKVTKTSKATPKK